MVRILIIGAGFGGISAVKSACDCIRKYGVRDAEVTLVSDRNYHLFTPLIYQISAGLANPYHVIQPVRHLAVKKNFRFIEAKVLDIGEDVVTENGTLKYDYLVIAMGSVSNDFGVKGASEYALFLKTLRDGEMIRNRLLTNLEAASSQPMSEEEKRKRLTVVVVGAGATGVELAGALADYLKTLRPLYPMLDIERSSRIVLLEAADRILPGMDDRVARATEMSLRSRGVEIITGAKVTEIGENYVEYSSGKIDTYNLLWTAGIKGNPIVEKLQGRFPVDKGKIKVDERLRVQGFRNVYAVGDIAVTADRLPATAAVAAQMGEYAGRDIVLSIIGRENEPFKYRNRGFMISLGRFSGVALLPSGLVFKGLAGWLVWRFVHLALIETLRSKIGILLDWTFAIFYRRIATQTDTV
jgi:NADH dehydrogenase